MKQQQIKLVGSQEVGKTCILNQLKKKSEFIQTYQQSIGYDQQLKKIQLKEGVEIVAKIQALPGFKNAENDEIIKSQTENADGVMLVFSLADQKSFKDIENIWLNMMPNNNSIKFILVGNKSDIQERQVSQESIDQFIAFHSRINYYTELSTISKEQVDECMTKLSQLIYDTNGGKVIKPITSNKAILNKELEKKGCACGLKCNIF